MIGLYLLALAFVVVAVALYVVSIFVGPDPVSRWVLAGAVICTVLAVVLAVLPA